MKPDLVPSVLGVCGDVQNLFKLRRQFVLYISEAFVSGGHQTTKAKQGTSLGAPLLETNQYMRIYNDSDCNLSRCFLSLCFLAFPTLGSMTLKQHTSRC